MSIGATLAQARRQAGLTIDQVSQETRIRPTIIRAVEDDDYEACGGDFYARGDIRSIAHVVGADPQQLISQYDMDHRATGPISATSINELLARSRPERRRRPGWALVTAVAVVVLVGLGAYYVLSGTRVGDGHAAVAAGNHAGQGHVARQHAAGAVTGRGARPVHGRGAGSAAGKAASPARSPSPSAAPRTGAPRTGAPRAGAPGGATPDLALALAPVRAAAFGGGLGGGDDPQSASLAIHGPPGAGWHTDWYTSARFGNLYAGTGLLLDMGHPVTVTAVRVTLGTAAGASFQIRVGSAPVLADLRPVATSSGPGGVVALRLSSPAQGRYVVVWFTRLPPDPAGTFQADVYHVGVTGRG